MTNLPKNDAKFPVKMPDILASKRLVSTDREALEMFKDDNYHDSIFITKYTDNSPNELYYFKVPKTGKNSAQYSEYNNEVEPMASKNPLVKVDKKIMGRFPYNAIGLISTGSGSGSGFLIAPSCAASAAHVFFNSEKSEWASGNYVFAPGASDDLEENRPYELKIYSVTISDMYYSQKNEAQYRDYDYSLIELNNNVGAVVGYFDYSVATKSLNGVKARVTGYPDPRRMKTPGHYVQYTSTGPIKSVHAFWMYYDLTTEDGMSGGPVYIESDDNMVVGVNGMLHKDPVTGEVIDYAGIGITQEMYDTFQTFDY